MGNVDLPEEIAAAQKHGAQGVGLVRTEFLVTGSDAVAAVNRRLLHLAGEEMRSPLLTLRNGAERLMVEQDNPAARNRRIVGMAQAAADLLRVADQMMESATLQPARPPAPDQHIDLAALVAGLVEQAQALAQGRGRSVVLRHCDAATVGGDAAQLGLALQELLDLLLAPAPVGSQIGVELFGDDDSARLVLVRSAARESDDYAGRPESGSSPEEPGLGLAWAREVIATMGGELRIDGTDGRVRQMLRVTLPRVRREPS
jgi:signal transduction histidine kinase